MDEGHKKSFDDPKIVRVLAAQFYVAKGLERNPAKMIKFMRDNKSYFPSVTENIIQKIMEENGLKEDDINKEPEVVLADIKSEEKELENLKKQSEKIHALRKDDHKKRNFGHGVKSYKEADEVQNIYKANGDTAEGDKANGDTAEGDKAESVAKPKEPKAT